MTSRCTEKIWGTQTSNLLSDIVSFKSFDIYMNLGTAVLSALSSVPQKIVSPSLGSQQYVDSGSSCVKGMS